MYQMLVDDKIAEFLHTHTANVGHSGRTLFKHLVGTHDLLKHHGEPDYVCLAGLFHSIYGTNIFTHASVPPTQREVIKDLIGEPAERLAYIFCTCDRPAALIEAAARGEPYYVLNRHDRSVVPLSSGDMRSLLAVEGANLEEQGVVSKVVRDAVSSIVLDT
jgi:hypothetical protein